MLNLRDPMLVPRTARTELYRTDMTVTNPNLTFLDDGYSKSYGMETMGTEGRAELETEDYDGYHHDPEPSQHPAYRARYLKEERRAKPCRNSRRLRSRDDQYDYSPRGPGRPDDDIQVMNRT